MPKWRCERGRRKRTKLQRPKRRWRCLSRRTMAAATAQWNKISRRARARAAGRCRPTPSRSRARMRPRRTFDARRLNFLGIVFCMMFGTAALAAHPDALLHDAVSVQAGEGDSVFWSLFFIFLLYFTAPCPGGAGRSTTCTATCWWARSFASLPAWASATGRKRGSGAAVNITDMEQGRHRAAGPRWCIGGDLIVLATPEIGGPAVRGVRPGGGRRPRGGALDRRWAAADDRQRAVARPVLQDDRPETRRPRAA